MLKTLRRRYTLYTMCIVTLLLSAMLGMVYAYTAARVHRQEAEKLDNLARYAVRGSIPHGLSDTPFFTVTVDRFGRATAGGSSYYFDTNDREWLTAVTKAALMAEESTGVLQEHSLRFRRVVTPLEQVIVFSDRTGELNLLRQLRLTCLTTGLVAFVLFLVLTLVMVRLLLKPVEKSWQAQRQFISDASHELKTPLTVILTETELLQAAGDADETAKHGGNILSMAGRMRELVESLLILARSDNGKIPAAFTEFDPAVQAEEAALTFEALLFEKDVLLETDLERGLTVRGNESRLRQVTDILLDNAQKYSAPGTAKLTLTRAGRKKCRLCLETPGEPLSKEEAKNIFRRFYRADRARSREEDGSFGLGLSIAESIAGEHGGRIWAEGDSEKNCNRFLVELPLINKG